MEKELLYKSRSFSSCIQASYRLMSDNFGRIFRSTWLPVLILSIMSGLFVTINMPSPEMFTLGMEHQTTFLSIFAVSMLGMLACSIWVSVRLVSMLNEQPRKWNLQRILLLIINTIVVCIVLYAIFFLAIWMAHRHTGGDWLVFFTDNWLAVLGMFIVIILAVLPLYYISVRYLCDENARFWIDFPKTYMIGVRHMGFIFLITLLLSIITGILILIIGMPLFILQAANTASLLGELSGDPVTLPKYFIFMVGITTFVVTFIASYIQMFPWIAYFFMYGSIEKQEEERNKNTTAIDSINLPDTQLV